MAADVTLSVPIGISPDIPASPTVYVEAGDFAGVLSDSPVKQTQSPGGSGGPTRPTTGFLYPRGQG